jgi:DNA-binding PadR family transcriptional regulator
MEPLQRVTAPTLDLLGLMLESSGPVFGFELMKRSGRPSGTVYPILERLERQGWIVSQVEDSVTTQVHHRRVYEFTPEGRAAAAELLA